MDDGIHVAEGIAGTPERFDVLSNAAARLTAGVEGWMSTHIGQPDIVRDTVRGTWLLYFEAEGPDAHGIGVVELSDDFSSVVTEPKLAVQAAVGAFIPFATIREPSVVIHVGEDSVRHWVMAARVSQDGTDSELAILRSEDGEDWLMQASTSEYALGLVTHREDRDAARGRFDDDGIASPSLLVHNGAWHLYYTGREGTRRGIGLLLSDELLGWRAASSSGAVFAAGHDQWNDVGVSDGDAIGDGDFVEMVYAGDDEARATLARVGRAGTDTGVTPF